MATFNDSAFKNTFEGMQSVTYSALVTLVNNSQLIPGKLYRITDYTTTTVQTDTQSAGNQFDVIVRADSNNVLNENAYAIHHTTSSSDYFYGQKLSAWELKYDINNNTDKYNWADSTNGKGVIYWMKDEYNNECGYDFKNIQFKRYKITATTTTLTNIVNKYAAGKEVGETSYYIDDSKFTISSSDTKFYYTFTLDDGTNIMDQSLNNSNNTLNNNCNNNIIQNHFNDTYEDPVDPNTKVQYLNNITLVNALSNNKFYNSINMYVNNSNNIKCDEVSGYIGITIFNSVLNNVFWTAMTGCASDIIFSADSQYYNSLENAYINNDLYKYCNSTEVETYRQDIINSIGT